jgi:uncharacterized damage-inducible protein DinB
MSASYDRLFSHLIWADNRTMESLRTTPAPEPKALQLLSHVLASEEVWISRIKGRMPSYTAWPELDLAACERLAAAVHEELREFVRSLDTEGSQRPIHYKNSVGAEFDSTIDDILQHLLLHGSYHRGQIAQLVRTAGGTPNPTDYIAFTRGAPAATRQ